MEDDVGTAAQLIGGVGELVGAVGVADPAGGLAPREGAGDDLHRVGHHKGGVEAQTEMADNTGAVSVLLSLALVLVDEVQSTRESDVAQVAGDLLLGHADAVVGYGEGARGLVHRDGDAVGLVLAALDLTEGDEALMLGHRVGGVGDQLAEKDVLFGVEPLLDDGEDVRGLYRDAARAAGVVLIHDGVPPWNA